MHATEWILRRTSGAKPTVCVNRPGWLQAIEFIDIDETSFGSPAPSGALQRELYREGGGEG